MLIILKCIFIIVLILLSVGLMIFESIWDNATNFSKWLFITDWIISSIFAIEYFYRFAYARKKAWFIIKPMNIVDFVAFLPFFLELVLKWIMDVSFLKALRLLRIFRIFKRWWDTVNGYNLRIW